MVFGVGLDGTFIFTANYLIIYYSRNISGESLIKVKSLPQIILILVYFETIYL